MMNLQRADKLMPQEEMLEVKKSKRSLTIGIPKEIASFENRIALVPNAVGQLVKHGHRVLIETDAGKAAYFLNEEYSEEGAEVVYTAEEVYQADIILKVAPLSYNEIDLLRNDQGVISSLQITNQEKDYFKKLIEKKTTAMAFEFIKDESGAYPILHSMSEIVGKAAVIIASEYQSNTAFGKGNMLGGFPGITPTEVVILGAGTVGENAAKTALGLGANIMVFDNNIYKLRRLLENLKQQVFTSIIQPKVLENALIKADVVIGALYSKEGMLQYLVSEDMVQKMKFGSVIIDVSIDQGGCFETSRMTTHLDPVFRKYDVTHYCVPNIASRYPHTASYALSNFFTPIILKIGEEGGINNMLKANYGISQGVYLYHGILTKKSVSELYDLPFQDLELLMAAF